MSIEIGDGGLGYIYLGDILIAGKGESGWHPGANTIAYYKFDGNCNDSSGNGYNMTNNGVTFETTLSDGTPVAYFNGSSYAIYSSLSKTLTQGTMNIWIKKNRNNNSECRGGLGSLSPDGEWSFKSSNTNTGNIGHILYYSSWVFQGYNNTGISNGTRMNICSVAGSSGNKFYINGQQVTLTYSQGSASASFGSRAFTTINIGRHRNASSDRMKGYASNWIIEDKEWTADEISAYYNQTKSKYGL